MTFSAGTLIRCKDNGGLGRITRVLKPGRNGKPRVRVWLKNRAECPESNAFYKLIRKKPEVILLVEELEKR